MKQLIHKNKALKKVIRETADVAGYLWQRGWAEGNAGNISVNITDFLRGEVSEPDPNPYSGLPIKYPGLALNYFFVTGTGKRMRDLADKPLKNALIIQLNEDAGGYRTITNRPDEELVLPTSELPTHLAIHQMIAERGSAEKVVMHTHATELTALTHAKEFCNQDTLNKLLWSMHTETAMLVPKGIGFVPFLLPGSVEIAEETVKVLQNHDVAVWEKHGVFAIGETVSGSFDIIDILTKSAQIFLLCRKAAIIPDWFTDGQIASLKKLGEQF